MDKLNIMLDERERNWLCRCERCGMYRMHDGVIIGAIKVVACMPLPEPYEGEK